jgi:beta-fructofuranosidase
VQPVFFRPTTGWVGDSIPFERDGEFWLFYLHEQRVDPKPGTPWRLVRTRDFVTFVDDGVALPAGGATDPDFNVYTGSVLVGDDGTAHVFYTGQNPQRLGANGLPVQLVMHATSTDGMRTWSKDPALQMGATPGYETADWRDPFVFRAHDDDEWRMLIAARHDVGPERRRGVIAQCVSDDLTTWRPVEPFWDPRRYITQECPDVFQWGEWWYLVYSEFSERFATRYRMSRSPEGPWLVPDLDTVDSRAFYAAKTVERGGRRFFVGWIATKEGESDDGPWQWAGDMSVLEARQMDDGTLAFAIPDELQDSFTDVQDLAFDLTSSGHASTDTAKVRLETADGYATAISTEEAPAQFFARFSVEVAADTSELGVLIRSSADGGESYVVRLEPRRQRMVFDRWPRRLTGPLQWHISGDVPHEVELERACVIEPGVHQIDLLVDRDVCIAVFDRSVVLTARMYDHARGALGVFAGEGTATFFDMTLATRA